MKSHPLSLKKLSLFIILFTTPFLVSGCSSIKQKIAELVIDKNAEAAKIEELKKGYEEKIEKKGAEVASIKDSVIAGKNSQIVAASNGLYGANFTFTTIATPTRTDLIVNNFVNESWTALGRITPDYPTLMKINERIKTELDETKTSIIQLKINHDKVIAENQALANNTKKLEADLVAVQRERAELKDKYERELIDKQGLLIQKQNKIINLEQERDERNEELKEIKMKFSMILGGLSLLALAGAIWSPVFKSELAIFSGLAGLLSIGIWLIQPWHVGLAAGLVAVGLVIWALIKFRREEKVSDALVLSAEDLKDSSKELWDSKIKPVIEERLKKYTKDAKGNIIAVKDASIEKVIDQKLAAFDRK
jgi:hypothetical protein